MTESNASQSQLSIAPLGAGDLIDRTVRLYRKNFWTFVMIAAPRVFLGTLFSMGGTMLGRQLFNIGTAVDPEELFTFQIFTLLGGLIIWFVETIVIMMVMGGASRNFIRHLLFNEAITFRETYSNTKKRTFGLMVAAVAITLVLGIFGIFLFYFGLIVAALLITAIMFVFSTFPVLGTVFSIIIGIAVAIITAWIFLLVSSRLAYIPQVMLVEGQNFFAALSRSISLASGNVKRFAALFVFTWIVTYSALALLYIPLFIYGSVNGINFFFSADVVPAWFQIANQLIGQVSLILLIPVWMIGLCLLYVDERVRHEGYDIELMAARQLGEIPNVPQTYINPLQPALSKSASVGQIGDESRARDSKLTTLGLE